MSTEILKCVIALGSHTVFPVINTPQMLWFNDSVSSNDENKRCGFIEDTNYPDRR